MALCVQCPGQADRPVNDAAEKKDWVWPQGPCIECDSTMLRRARQRIADQEEPFYSYWKGTEDDRQQAMKLKAVPYQGKDSLRFHQVAQEQGIAARLLAYTWHLEGKVKEGAKAIELLYQWASASPLPGTQFDSKIRFPNSGMDVARSMLPFISTFDLLGKHPELTGERRERIEKWFRALVQVVQEGMQRWEQNDDFGGQAFQNHHAAHAMGLVLFGVALRDQRLIELGSDSPANPKDFKDLVAGLILMPGDRPTGGLRNKPLHAGEINDRHRTNEGAGLTYCHLSLTLMLYTAEVLTRVTNQDWVNHKAPGGECLRLSATFYSDFYRLKNARINGDYYFRDQKALRNNKPFQGTFEVALSHWPDVPNLKAIVRSMDRKETPRSWLCYYGLPLLTHGVDKP